MTIIITTLIMTDQDPRHNPHNSPGKEILVPLNRQGNGHL